MYAFTVLVCLGFPFCIPTCLIHTLVEWQLHLLCVTEHKWDPQLCNIWRVLKYWFQMKKGTTLSCLSCHGNVWNVSCAPGKMNTDKSHHTTSNWQLLCFFGVPARNAFIIFTSCCAYLVKKQKKPCVSEFSTVTKANKRMAKEMMAKEFCVGAVRGALAGNMSAHLWLAGLIGDNLLLSPTCRPTGRCEEFSLSCNTTQETYIHNIFDVTYFGSS